MIIKNILTKSAAVIAGLILSSAASQAASFHVDIDTAALNSLSASAPVSLDFQFNDGGTLGNNTATISNFTFGSGAATDSAFTLGGALGDIGSTVTFDNSSSFQELFQTFNVGTTIGFDVALTEFSDGETPDSFSVAILDNNLVNITTNGIGDSLFQANITPGLAITAANFSSGTGDFAGVTAIPEPATSAAMIGGIALMAVALSRRATKRTS